MQLIHLKLTNEKGYSSFYAHDDITVDMYGTAFYESSDGYEIGKSYSGGFGERTYGQIKVTCPANINQLTCAFELNGEYEYYYDYHNLE